MIIILWEKTNGADDKQDKYIVILSARPDHFSHFHLLLMVL